jgi:hypothetical protein
MDAIIPGMLLCSIIVRSLQVPLLIASLLLCVLVRHDVTLYFKASIERTAPDGSRHQSG